MIKLQLLLRRPALQPELDGALRARMERLGMQITGVGRATVSADMTPANFESVFQARPPSGAQTEADLPIPSSLRESVTLITIAPHHIPTDQTGKGPHAAI